MCQWTIWHQLDLQGANVLDMSELVVRRNQMRAPRLEEDEMRCAIFQISVSMSCNERSYAPSRLSGNSSKA